MKLRRVFACCILLQASISACSKDSDPILPPPTAQPPAIVGAWRARDVGGAVLPAIAHRFPGDSTDPGVSDFRLDSAELTLTSDGRYTSARYMTELFTTTPDDPGSWRARSRSRERDHGLYTLSGDSLTLTSNWIQNVVVPGNVIPSVGLIRLRPELKQVVDEPIVNIGYVRMQ